jgi:hypothetical protein
VVTVLPASTTLKLDRAAIAALLADTQHVQQTLNEAMTEQASHDDTGRGDTGEEADGNGASAINVAEGAGLPSETDSDHKDSDDTSDGSQARTSEPALPATLDIMGSATADTAVRNGAKSGEHVGDRALLTEGSMGCHLATRLCCSP